MLDYGGVLILHLSLLLPPLIAREVSEKVDGIERVKNIIKLINL